MEDPEEEDWDYEEYYYYYYNNSSKQYLNKESNFDWFMRKGFSFGKNAVLTGVVISWAPLFLPSLVVVSALGLAVSVPAGVVLASVTCTEKLMSKLLPISDFEYTIFEEELGDEIEQFDVVRTDEEDSFSIELDSYEQTNDIMLSKAAECRPEYAGEVPVLDIKKVVDNDVSRDKSKGVKRNKKKSKYSCLKISHRIGERDSKKEILLKKHNGVNLVPIVEMKSSSLPNSGNGISDKTVGVFKDSDIALHKVHNEDNVSYKVNAKIPASEVLVPGEKILWDKVDAVRLIVGYKAARKPSLSEELKALYVFTGIEPTSSSFKNSNSSGHVHRTEEEKLRFLMSIIGLK